MENTTPALVSQGPCITKCLGKIRSARKLKKGNGTHGFLHFAQKRIKTRKNTGGRKRKSVKKRSTSSHRVLVFNNCKKSLQKKKNSIGD